jgi:predicted HTH domain antitoxin
LKKKIYQVTIDVPEETALSLKIAPEKLGEEMRLVAAIKLYELGKISSGAAANLAGIPKVVFLTKLADYGVDTFKSSQIELIEDLNSEKFWH